MTKGICSLASRGREHGVTMHLSSLLSGNGEMEGGASPATDQSCIHMTKSLMASHRNPVSYLPIPSLTRKHLLSHPSHTRGGG